MKDSIINNNSAHRLNNDQFLENWSFKYGIPLFIENVSKLKRENCTIYVSNKIILNDNLFANLDEYDKRIKYKRKKGCYFNKIEKSLIIFPLKNIDGSIYGILRITGLVKNNYKFEREKKVLEQFLKIILTLFNEIQQNEFNSILEEIIK